MADDVRYRDAESRLWMSMGLTPREHRIRLARLGSEVRIQEIGSGPPLLFLHGATTCGTSWAGLAAGLPDRRCLLLDRPGTGLSAPHRPPIGDVAGLSAAADALVADVLDAMGLERVDLVASSFGGLFALRAAIAHPGRIRRLALLGWSAGAPTTTLPLAMRLGSSAAVGRLAARLPVTRGTVRQLLRGLGLADALARGRVSDEAVDAYAALLRWTDTLRNDLAIGSRVLGRAGLDPRILLTAAERSSIAIPVLVVWGERDPFGGVTEARAFSSPFPDVRLELLPATGHAPWMDDAPGIAARLARFLG